MLGNGGIIYNIEKEPYETLKSFRESYEVDHNSLSLLTDSLYNNTIDAM